MRVRGRASERSAFKKQPAVMLLFFLLLLVVVVVAVMLVPQIAIVGNANAAVKAATTAI